MDADLPERELARARRLQQAGEFADAEAGLRALVAGGGEADAASALLAAVLFLAGKGEEAGKLLAAAAKAEPDDAAWASDLGFAFFLAGEFDRARALLERAVALPGADAAAFNRLATVWLVASDLAKAEAGFREAVLRDPNRAEVHNNLGGALVRREKLEDALVHYERAVALKPDLRQALDGRAAVLLALDRADEAVARLAGELEADPESLDCRRRLARALAIADRFQEAEDHWREVVEKAPDDVEARIELALLLLRQDRYPAACKALKEALERESESVPLLVLLAGAETELQRLEEAEKTVARARAINAEAPGVFHAEAELTAARQDYAAAEATLRRGIELYPGAPDLLARLGHTLLWVGRLDEAVERFEQAARINPGALAALVAARRFPEDDATVERMAKFARNPLIPSEARAAMEFALAQVFESRRDYDAAFAHADRANELTRRTFAYDPNRFSREVEAVMRVFRPALFKRCRGIGNPSARPVFVCGMPRSGTTLAEQVLASHPDVFGAGELGTVPAITHLMPVVVKARRRYPLCMGKFTARTADHAARYYLEKIAALDSTAARVVDKLPHNFVHLGLIAVLFPNARIIHLARDPRDVAVSNYFQNFKAKRGGMGYAFDLGHIGRQINDHDRLMDHWRRVLPVPIMDLDYEDLVEDQEATTRRLLDFVGVGWDDRVLAFHKTERPVRTASVWQVRQPLYATSREKWRRYEAFLGPLDEALADGP